MIVGRVGAGPVFLEIGRAILIVIGIWVGNVECGFPGISQAVVVCIGGRSD